MDHKAAPNRRHRQVNLSRAQTATIGYGTVLLIAAVVPLTAYLPTSKDTPADVTTLTALQPAAVTNPQTVKLPAGFERTTTKTSTDIYATTAPCWTLTIPADQTQSPVISKKPTHCATRPSPQGPPR